MAGHSQFKNIMHRKGRQDAARSKMFSKLAREITVAAKTGMPDPAMNPRLRLAVQNAKAESMPKDNIQRAINKAIGGEAENYEEVRYEGYGPGGVAHHRRGADRQSQPDRFQRARGLHQGGRRAGRNRLGLLHVGPGRRDHLSGKAGSADKVMDAAIEAGADDVESGEEGHTIICAFENVGDVSKALESTLGEAELGEDHLAAAEQCPCRRGARALAHEAGSNARGR